MLKFERHNTSQLARFLICRELKVLVVLEVSLLLNLLSQSSYNIAHFLFLHVRAEMQLCPKMQERYALLLEEYLCKAAWHAEQLNQQVRMIDALQVAVPFACRLLPNMCLTSVAGRL